MNVNYTPKNEIGQWCSGAARPQEDIFAVYLRYRLLQGDPEYHVCKRFGCGKRLTDFDMLFGDKCPMHSAPASGTDITRHVSH